MPVTSSSQKNRDEPEDSGRYRRSYRKTSTSNEDSDKLPRSSKHKHSSSSSLGSRKVSSSSTLRRSTSRDKSHGYKEDRDTLRSPTKLNGASRKSSAPVPEMERRTQMALGGDEERKSAYPTFSKAHSREAVGSREQIVDDVPTQQYDDYRRGSAPPAPGDLPPMHAGKQFVNRSRSRSDLRDTTQRLRAEDHNLRNRRSGEMKAGSIKAARSGASLRNQSQADSELSSMPGAFPDEAEKTTPASSYRRTVSTNSQHASTITQNTEESFDSDATSVAAEDRRHKKTHTATRTSPASITDSQPKTPTPSEPYMPPSEKTTPISEFDNDWQSLRSGRTINTAMPPPPPPPPPPLMAGPATIPRVDYLLKNGGLPYMISKKLIQPPAEKPVHQFSMYHAPMSPEPAALEEYKKVFSGVYKGLDDYIQVLNSNGSIAVATGYRSVARRLLDKLSQIFARDISSERCDCVICKTTPQASVSEEEDTGISWGEILEFVSGRRELPQWPPFFIQPEQDVQDGAGDAEVPMQKIDVDVPEEYREHYTRQNQKTKLVVQKWLEQQPILPTSPPDEADEDTLMFAMMTKLNLQERNLFIALMHGQTSISEIRAPTPAERPATSSTPLKRTRRALQRLYRLERPPRDCECAMYLLNNAHLHGMLATLAEVNEQEWDILISGRFDGFLWSGAETGGNGFAASPVSRGPSRNMNATPISRGGTPFSGLSGIPSRGPTPSVASPLRNVMSPEQQFAGLPSVFPSRGPTPGLMGASIGAPGPVQLDEETEIAVLAELERNIFTDMERLEDAFEMLHGRAEQVRKLLRERSAGLSMQAQARRGLYGIDPGVRLDTPASGITDFEEGGHGDGDSDDDGLGDVASLAPDDSASQISYNRRARKRRERHTPAPVAEEDEGGLPSNEKERVRDWRERRDGRRSVPRR